MAKQYRALSNIEHGEEVADGNEITRFPYGSIVEGLPADVMKNLWDAGVLEEVESAPPQVTKTVVTAPPKGDQSKGEEPKGDGKAGGGSETPPAAPGATPGSPKP